MTSGTHRTSTKSLDSNFLTLVIGLGVLTTLLAIGLYAYLGTFSRYGGDDYCLSAFFKENGTLFSRMVDRYMNSSSRYTNILFIGLVDALFGWYNVAILPPLMLGLFVFGTYLLLKEAARLAALRWSRLLILFLAALIVYFSVLQAPNLYETLYWRAGMTSHFAPLVFLTFLGAFLVREMRLAGERYPSIWTQVFCFLAALVLGGFSEPPLTMLIAILALALLVLWLWDHTVARHARMLILFWTLAGSFLALVILAVAPANSIRLGTPPPGPVELVLKTFQYPMEFIGDVFRSLPLSTLITFLLPAVLFYVYYSRRDTSYDSRWIAFSIIAVSVLSYLLIAASFAPSVYGQSFPVPRARFSGRVILTCALMVNGALIGMLAAKVQAKLTASVVLQWFAIFILMLLTLYPLRTAYRTALDIPAYQQRAAAWDARDADIRTLSAEGQKDLAVPLLPGEIIKDLGDYTEYRLNRCASLLYKINSIRAFPMDNQ